MVLQRLDTIPEDTPGDVALPRLGPLGWLRWAWRQLTSMRTALSLLMLLAVAAVPGSIWPQRGVDAGKVADYLAAHPGAGPWLDRLGFFDVYESPWFSSVYLLLFASLVGCVLPRARLHWRALRAQPPRAPRRLDRLPQHRQAVVEAPPEVALAAARSVLARRRFRLRAEEEEGAVSAEGGYLRETGNLVFHLALIVVLVGVAVGHLVGWRGDRILPVGDTLANTVSGYDTFDPGPWVDTAALTPFTVTLDALDVSFERLAGGAQFGAPRDFTATTRTTAAPGQPSRVELLKVNGPLQFGGASVFLLGNGYAPVVTVKDAAGAVLYSGATPFLPRDANYRSVGAVKVPAATPAQLGFLAVFLPTAEQTYAQGPRSLFPDLLNPELAMTVYQGKLNPPGRAASVYTLDTTAMTQVRDSVGKGVLIRLKPGQTAQLPGGRGSITFDRVVRWAGISVRYDPGKGIALAGALLALLGLVASLTVRRRRVFVRVLPEAGTGRTVVVVGGLARGGDAGEDPATGGLLDDLLAQTSAMATDQAKEQRMVPTR